MDTNNAMAQSILATAARIDASVSAPLPAMVLASPEGGTPVTGGFLSAMHAAVLSVDAKDQRAAEKVADVDSGRSDDMVGAMLASQEASLSFSLLMQVRNKVMGAMEDVIKLQV
ncbi:flagellar hook-basal body complex protein FliE [Paracidovorax anthurii]|uniref:Flagellar hook-basal body complex protein FliE n=1 Tax=Paracidovorax anthurii TaxID=78229 RepID=A0A328YTW2_9BURK|nr:flagellar hook-basal body complex protein FliE [Paracidovorax anthurii]RAR76854.1 flagellar hook-basal body complex protein FliE [Paracidovorax anthurii]WCM93797.1 flagellar hook-basal body complex protein FliE [Acidovorax sp. NCPPB 2350]